VQVAVHGYLVSGGGHLGGKSRVLVDHGAQHEERGLPPKPIERLEERRGGVGLGAVVEREGQMVGEAHPGEAGEGVTAQNVDVAEARQGVQRHGSSRSGSGERARSHILMSPGATCTTRR